MKGLKKLKGLIACLSIIVLSVSLTGCGKKEEENKKKETPLFEQYDFQFSSAADTYELPAYFYTINANKKRFEFEGAEFSETKSTYTFRDFNKSEPDENGNVTISYVCDIKSDMVLSVSENANISETWYYTYYELNPGAFDYYTGNVLLTNRVSLDAETTVLDNGIEKKDINEMKYTDVSFNGKEIKVGRRDEIKFNGWQGIQDLGTENGIHKYKDSASSTITYYFSVPKNYDGIVIVLNKKGSTKEGYDKAAAKYEEKVKLQKEAEETGVKSDRLIEIEKEDARVYKIIDPEDEERKDKKPEDYIVIRLSDSLKDKEQ